MEEFAQNRKIQENQDIINKLLLSFDTSLLYEKDHLTLADQSIAIARQRCISELIGNFIRNDPANASFAVFCRSAERPRKFLISVCASSRLCGERHSFN